MDDINLFLFDSTGALIDSAATTTNQTENLNVTGLTPGEGYYVMVDFWRVGGASTTPAGEPYTLVITALP